MLWSYFTDRGHICHGWGVITKWQITFNYQFFRNFLHSYDEPWGKKALTVMMPLWGFDHGFRTFIRETQDRRYSYSLRIARTFCFFFLNDLESVWLVDFFVTACNAKFPLRISLLNVNKSAENCGFIHIY